MITPGQSVDSPMLIALLEQLRVGRPVGLDTGDHKNRNVIQRRFCHTKQWRGRATRYDTHAVP